MLNRTGLGNGRKLQAQILHALLQGRSPDRIELLRNGVAVATRRAWEDLVRSGAVVVDESGKVVTAYPLSPTPTKHIVEVESFKGQLCHRRPRRTAYGRTVRADHLGMCALWGSPSEGAISWTRSIYWQDQVICT